MVKNLPTMQKIWVWSLGQEDPLEKEMAAHSSILAWEIPWTEEPGKLQSMWSHKVGHNLATKEQLKQKLMIQCLRSVAKLCLTLWPYGLQHARLPVHHQLLEIAQTHVYWIGDAIKPSHLLLSPSLPSFDPSQHQSLFKWVSSSHQVAKVLELQLQH